MFINLYADFRTFSASVDKFQLIQQQFLLIVDNGAFLAAVQWISSLNAVTGTKADAADADGSFLHFRDVHHREADEIAVFSLKDKLIEVVGSADGNDAVTVGQLGGGNGSFGYIKFTAFN